MIRLMHYALAGLQLCCIALGLECHGFERANGLASYILSGGLSSTNCSILWSSNGTVISWKDEFGEDHSEDVLAQESNGILLKTCKTDLHYKEECPALGVVINVPCSCNCSITDSGTLDWKGGLNRTHIVAVVIAVLAAVAMLFLVYGLVCRKKGRREEEGRLGTVPSIGDEYCSELLHHSEEAVVRTV